MKKLSIQDLFLAFVLISLIIIIIILGYAHICAARKQSKTAHLRRMDYSLALGFLSSRDPDSYKSTAEFRAANYSGSLPTSRHEEIGKNWT